MIWLPRIFESDDPVAATRSARPCDGAPCRSVNFPGRLERVNMTTKIKEHVCEACMGTGYPVVMQPIRPGRKIYPVKCEACEGKGKIADAN